MREVRVERVGHRARELLSDGREFRVFAAFERSCYVERATESRGSRGLIACLGDADLGAGPLNAACAASPTGWRIGETIVVDSEEAALWCTLRFPTPDRAAVERGLRQLAAAVQGVDFPAGLGPLIEFLAIGGAPLSPLPGGERVRERGDGDSVRRPPRPNPLPKGEGGMRSVFANDDAPQGVVRFYPERESELDEGLIEHATPAIVALSAALSAGDTDGVHAAAIGLLGLGPGLTPSGDDCIGGAMATRHALWWQAPTETMRSLLDAAETRTNRISLAHLRCAVDGELAEEMQRALAALLLGNVPDLDAVAAIGHGSGWDTLAGITLVLRAWLRSPAQLA